MAKQFGARRRVPRDTRDLIRDLKNAVLRRNRGEFESQQQDAIDRAYTWLDNTRDAETPMYGAA